MGLLWVWGNGLIYLCLYPWELWYSLVMIHVAFKGRITVNFAEGFLRNVKNKLNRQTRLKWGNETPIKLKRDFLSNPVSILIISLDWVLCPPCDPFLMLAVDSSSIYYNYKTLPNFAIARCFINIPMFFLHREKDRQRDRIHAEQPNGIQLIEIPSHRDAFIICNTFAHNFYNVHCALRIINQR